MTASQSELTQYGYLPRPDAAKHPQLRALWDRHVRRKPRIIIPPSVSTSAPHPAAKRLGGFRRILSSDAAGWAGAMITAPAGQVIYLITGTWIVPTPEWIVGDTTDSGEWSVGAWVELQDPGTSEYVAVGTSVECNVSDGAIQPGTVQAWPWEFYGPPVPPKVILTVKPGDTVSATIWSGTGNFDDAYYQLSSTSGGSTPVTQLTGQSFNATSAQWAVGFLPRFENEAEGGPGPLTGNTVFTNAYILCGPPNAGEFGILGTTEVNLNAPTATLVTMDNTGYLPKIVQLLDSTSIRIIICTIS